MPNVPNEPGAWDADFTYGYLKRLFAVLAHDFVPTRLGEAGVSETDGVSRRVFVRHDIAVSLERALPIARLESECGIAASYHVMIDSPFYDVRSQSSADALTEIAALGHEIGLHYDILARSQRDAAADVREADIARACEELEAVVSMPVHSLSLHVPVQELINGPLHVGGRVNGEGSAVFGWYISDVRGYWREGEPLESLKHPRGQNLQIVIHPIWWGPEHMDPTLRLRDFLHDVGPRLGGTYEELNERLWQHIAYRAADAG